MNDVLRTISIQSKLNSEQTVHLPAFTTVVANVPNEVNCGLSLSKAVLLYKIHDVLSMVLLATGSFILMFYLDQWLRKIGQPCARARNYTRYIDVAGRFLRVGRNGLAAMGVRTRRIRGSYATVTVDNFA